MFLYVPGRNNDNILLILDGHKTHVAVDIIKWQYQRSVIIHVLSGYTSRHYSAFITMSVTKNDRQNSKVIMYVC